MCFPTAWKWIHKLLKLELCNSSQWTSNLYSLSIILFIVVILLSPLSPPATDAMWTGCDPTWQFGPRCSRSSNSTTPLDWSGVRLWVHYLDLFIVIVVWLFFPLQHRYTHISTVQTSMSKSSMLTLSPPAGFQCFSTTSQYISQKTRNYLFNILFVISAVFDFSFPFAGLDIFKSELKLTPLFAYFSIFSYRVSRLHKSQWRAWMNEWASLQWLPQFSLEFTKPLTLLNTLLFMDVCSGTPDGTLTLTRSQRLWWLETKYCNTHLTSFSC